MDNILQNPEQALSLGWTLGFITYRPLSAAFDWVVGKTVSVIKSRKS